MSSYAWRNAALTRESFDARQLQVQCQGASLEPPNALETPTEGKRQLRADGSRDPLESL